MSDQFFVSYSHDDFAFVDKLVEDLSRRFLYVWQDFREIRPGQPWERTIETALDVCGGLLVVLSPRAIASPSVRKEIKLAVRASKGLLPIRIEECEPPPELADLQYVDFVRRDYETALSRLVTQLQEIALLSDPTGPAMPWRSPFQFNAAITIGRAILSEARPRIAAGARLDLVCSGILKGAELIEEALLEHAEPLKDLEREAACVATTAGCEPDEGSLLAHAVRWAGMDRLIFLKTEQATPDTYAERIDGMLIEHGFASRHFITDEVEQAAELTDPRVLVCDFQPMAEDSLEPVIELLRKNREQGLVVIAPEFSEEALSVLLVARRENRIPTLAIGVPPHPEDGTELLEDIAVATGATVISAALRRRIVDVGRRDLGRAKSIVSRETETVIRGGGARKQALRDRTNSLRMQLGHANSLESNDRLRVRLGRLAQSEVHIHVGGATHEERKGVAARMEHSLRALLLAMEAGVLPGGGVALLNASRRLGNPRPKPKTKAEELGIEAVRLAATAPMKQIATNSGHRASEILQRVAKLREKTPNAGYDPNVNRCVDMVESGILEPTRPIQQAVRDGAIMAVDMLKRGLRSR